MNMNKVDVWAYGKIVFNLINPDLSGPIYTTDGSSV